MKIKQLQEEKKKTFHEIKFHERDNHLPARSVTCLPVWIDLKFLRQKQSKLTHAFLSPERMSQLLRRTLVRATRAVPKRKT